MVKKVLSIVIGIHKTKISVVDYKKKNPKVYETLVLDTPYDSIEDGYIKDKIALAEAIQDKLRQSKIKISNVIFTISSSKIANREITIPLVKENKIKTVVDAGAADYFPIPIEEYNISYTILEKVTEKEDKHYRLLILATHNNLLMSYYELAEVLHFNIVTIDYIGNSVYHMLQKQGYIGTNMFVQINENNSLINILRQDVLILQRTIPYGFNNVVEALINNPNYQDMNVEQGRLVLLNQKIINHQFGLLENTNDRIDITLNHSDFIEDESKQQDDNLVKEQVTESLHYLINNVLRVVDYYTTKNPEYRINYIYLFGVGSKIKTIEQLFQNEIGYETTVMDKLNNIIFVGEQLQEYFSQSDFIANIGVVIAPVGMVPKQYILKTEKKSSIQSIVVISSLAIITSLVLFITSSKSLSDVKASKEELLSKIEDNKDINNIYTENTKRINDLNILNTIEEYSYSYNEELNNLITELEDKLPESVTIHSFRATETEIVMDITVDSKETAAMTLIQLKKVSILTNVTTSSISEQKDDYGFTQVNFSITASYTATTNKKEGAE